ncbi:CAU/MBL1b family subclass B3 metallo-beta-lactamase [soil metagenome]
MKSLAVVAAMAAFAGMPGMASARAQDDPLTRPIPSNPAWLVPQAPVRVFGNTYFVGTQGLSLALIDTGQGLILIDGAVPQAVADIEANITRLGFRIQDVRYILNTEAHFDHSGGLAALARDSGATVIAGPLGVEALRAGRALSTDPQATSLEAFPAVANVRALADGQTLTLGDVTITAVLTPGHTPGSASWTWRSCEGAECHSVVFASSLNAIAAKPFTYTGHPQATAALRASIKRVEGLDCDILISAHPDNSGGIEKLAGRVAGATPNTFIDPTACRAYAARARGILDRRLTTEADAH